jgi:hypothetical protein
MPCNALLILSYSHVRSSHAMHCLLSYSTAPQPSITALSRAHWFRSPALLILQLTSHMRFRARLTTDSKNCALAHDVAIVASSSHSRAADLAMAQLTTYRQRIPAL